LKIKEPTTKECAMHMDLDRKYAIKIKDFYISKDGKTTAKDISDDASNYVWSSKTLATRAMEAMLVEYGVVMRIVALRPVQTVVYEEIAG